jgi:two-component system response regulator WspF
MRIAIVNDLPLAREVLRRVVASGPGLEVAWLAADGAEALEKVRADRPDLVLMDLYMPVMDGAEATRRIMKECPCPILVVTATVQGHIDRVYEAMSHGALDAIDTPSLGKAGEVAGGAALLEKIRRVGRLAQGPCRTTMGATSLRLPPLVAIGASTGGPGAIRTVLAGLSGLDHAAILIDQHVDPAFAPGLAAWLAGQSRLPVELIRPGQPPTAGKALLAGTGDHVVLEATGTLAFVVEPRDACYRPSIDVFFRSLAHHAPVPGVAVLLTGMGRDGADGLLELRQRGWYTIAQDEATSIVWGMPRAAVACGAAVDVLPLDAIADAIVSHLPHPSRSRSSP